MLPTLPRPSEENTPWESPFKWTPLKKYGFRHWIRFTIVSAKSLLLPRHCICYCNIISFVIVAVLYLLLYVYCICYHMSLLCLLCMPLYLCLLEKSWHLFGVLWKQQALKLRKIEWLCMFYYIFIILQGYILGLLGHFLKSPSNTTLTFLLFRF